MKGILIFFIIFLLFFNCENRKKKGILPTAKLEDLMILYFFTDGASIMNNCDTRFNYTVGKVNEPVSGTNQVAIRKYYSLKEGNYLYVRNSNSSSDCLVRASFTFCDLLNNEVLNSSLSQTVCKNLSANNVKLLAKEERICFLNEVILNQFRNSVILSVWASNESSANSEICSYYGEMK
ncbi:MAG TPA: hypothetical protein PKA14_25440 [Leptospiraceae bacterium]|nr:hypothetical protein [Leptospiraceae bacterium]